jgi:hypothetical protein
MVGIDRKNCSVNLEFTVPRAVETVVIVGPVERFGLGLTY